MYINIYIYVNTWGLGLRIPCWGAWVYTSVWRLLRDASSCFFRVPTLRVNRRRKNARPGPQNVVKTGPKTDAKRVPSPP